MSELLPQKPYYFLHTMVGLHDYKFGAIMDKANRGRGHLYKLATFLSADTETPGGVGLAMGLDLREVMCTVSKVSPAVTYHNNYGLVLEGTVKRCFDNDSGCVLQNDGTYNDFVFDFTNPTTTEDLLSSWYPSYEKELKLSPRFTWNEAVLEKGSRVAGIFYDRDKSPRHPDSYTEFGTMTEGEEFEEFREKARRCGLAVLHINALH